MNYYNLVIFGFEVRATPARVVAFLVAAFVMLVASIAGWILTFGWVVALVVVGLPAPITIRGTEYSLIRSELVRDWVGKGAIWMGWALLIYHFFF